MSVTALSNVKAEADAQTEEPVRSLRDRTPEQVTADRERILSRSRKPLPLPPGKTLEDIIVGQWPGDETDEEIEAALRELS